MDFQLYGASVPPTLCWSRVNCTKKLLREYILNFLILESKWLLSDMTYMVASTRGVIILQLMCFKSACLNLHNVMCQLFLNKDEKNCHKLEIKIE